MKLVWRRGLRVAGTLALMAGLVGCGGGKSPTLVDQVASGNVRLSRGSCDGQPTEPVKILAGQDELSAAIERGSLTLGMTQATLASTSRSGNCWTVATPGITPRAWVRFWEEQLRSSPRMQSLLSPIAGVDAFVAGLTPHVAGLEARVDGLGICTSGPERDLPLRLLHPSVRIDPLTEKEKKQVRHAVWAPSTLDAGAEPLRLLDRLPTGVDGSRVRSWDRLYFLRIDPTRRWVNDPSLRRYIATKLLDSDVWAFLPDGNGQAWDDPFLGDAFDERTQRTRPLGEQARPRLQFAFDGADPKAVSLARRIQAVMFAEKIELVPVDLDDEPDGEWDLRLSLHRRWSQDPLLAAEESLLDEHPSGDTARTLLVQSRAVEDRLMRLEALQMLSRMVRDEGTLVPLAQQPAFLAGSEHRNWVSPAYGLFKAAPCP